MRVHNPAPAPAPLFVCDWVRPAWARFSLLEATAAWERLWAQAHGCPLPRPYLVWVPDAVEYRLVWYAMELVDWLVYSPDQAGWLAGAGKGRRVPPPDPAVFWARARRPEEGEAAAQKWRAPDWMCGEARRTADGGWRFYAYS